MKSGGGGGTHIQKWIGYDAHTWTYKMNPKQVFPPTTQLNRCVKCLNKLCKVLHNPCETYELTNSCVKSYTTLVV